ncbi:LysE family translocator [Nocardia sp. NPDC020380]|uniref:LysE family translocator n=1 Tax=Nocardia sp. NPDC020380 TaxID=3364309 RepID=UPI00378FE7F4
MSIALLLSFLGLCILLALTPGPDTFLVLRFSMAGSRQGVAAAIGSAFGGLVWAVVVAAGVAALLEQSATAYRTLKVVGGIYLLYLGVRALLAHRREQGRAAAELDEVGAELEAAGAQRETAGAARGASSLRSAFAAGLLSCIFNPKVGLFYLAVLPQFLTHVTFGGTLTLGAIESTIAAIEMVAVAVAASRAVAMLKRPKVRARLEQASAAILAALGIGTAASAV